jgi:hypothetical protein
MTEVQTRRWAMLWPDAFVLGLALLTGGCASSAPSPTACDALFNSYENNNTLTEADWDRAYKDMDTNGDGAVTLDEYHAAVSRAGGGGRR